MIKIGNTELSKIQSIALIAGIVIILGAAGGYWWFFIKNAETTQEAVTEEAAVNGEGEQTAEGEPGAEGEATQEGEAGTEAEPGTEGETTAETGTPEEGEDLFSDVPEKKKSEAETMQDEDVFALFDEEEGKNGNTATTGEAAKTETTGTETAPASDATQQAAVAPQPTTEAQTAAEQASAKAAEQLIVAKEKGNIIDLESKNAAKPTDATSKLPEGKIVDILKKEGDKTRVEPSTATSVTPAATTPVTEGVAAAVIPEIKKPKPKATSYQIKAGDTFEAIAKKHGYPATFQTALEFLAKNPTSFQSVTESEEGRLSLVLAEGKTLKFPAYPFRSSGLYSKEGKNISTYAIEFYESDNEASAEVVRDTLTGKGINAYIKPFGPSFQVMIGFFNNKETAEEKIREASLLIGRSDESIQLVKLTRGVDSYDEYVARARVSYYIQLVESDNRPLCERILEKAKSVQVKDSILNEAEVKGRMVCRVRVGYFNSRYEAVSEGKFLKRNVPEVKDFILKKGEMGSN